MMKSSEICCSDQLFKQQGKCSEDIVRGRDIENSNSINTTLVIKAIEGKDRYADKATF